MPDNSINPPEEIERLQKRARKLAIEKSWLQLIISLMNKLSINPGLENTINNLLTSVVEVIGGTNTTIHYLIDDKIYYADLLGTKKQLDIIEDQQVLEVLNTGLLLEIENDFSQTLMKTAEFSKSWTWLYPLKLGNETIAVIKIENMHMGTYELSAILPTFFNYAALILNNEIKDYTRLENINRTLHQTNQSLHQEIAERKKYEQMLSESKKEAEQANRSKSVFLANMSHELRTPLNAILGFSQLMRSELDCSHNQCENIDIINRSGKHLLALINDVLDMSKIEAGRMEVTENSFNLAEFVTDIIDMMLIRAEAKGLDLHLDLSPQLPLCIETDENKLRQMLINLLANAVKFTTQGKITLRLKNSPDPDNSSGQFTLLCEVEDTGKGLSDKNINEIFQPFTQISHKNDHSGTGLGLTITRQFITLLNGNIEVESELGKGSIFRLKLPVKIASTLSTITPLSIPGKTLQLTTEQSKQPILIIEDQQDSRLLLQTILQNIGFFVIEASNNKEAISRYKKYHPRLIWIDISTSKIDRYTIISFIRQLPDGDKVKIIALTTSGFEDKKQKCLDADCDDILLKPYQLNDVYHLMAKYLHIKWVEDNQINEKPTSACLLSHEQIISLPAELRLKLKEAAILLDMNKFISLLQQLRSLDNRLADGLEDLAKNYHFDKILALFKDE